MQKSKKNGRIHSKHCFALVVLSCNLFSMLMETAELANRILLEYKQKKLTREDVKVSLPMYIPVLVRGAF